MKNEKCLICESADIKTLNGYESCGLVICNNCKFVFMHKIPTALELQNYYSSYAYSQDQNLSALTLQSYNQLLDEFEKYRKTNNIIDVGCGRGWFLEIAKKRGWNVYGTEFSSKAIEICINKGINMKEGVLNPNDFNGISFDVIFSSEVLEHINNPTEELSNFYTILRKGGLLYITTPNFNSYLRYIHKNNYNIITYPEHLCYYTSKTLNTLLQKNGFQRKKVLTTGVSITRFEMSSKNTKPKELAKESKDERLRKLMNKNNSTKILKKLVNKILTFLGIGMTIKAFYVK